MTPIRNEKQEIIGYRQEQPDDRVKIRDKHGELVGWTAFGQTKAKDGKLVSFQEREGVVWGGGVAVDQTTEEPAILRLYKGSL